MDYSMGPCKKSNYLWNMGFGLYPNGLPEHSLTMIPLGFGLLTLRIQRDMPFDIDCWAWTE